MKKVLLTALITIALCIGLLVMTALIPQSAIRDNVSKSADELLKLELFDNVTDNVFPTRQDNYADAILVNIMYNIDNRNLLRSLVSMPYYNPEHEAVNVSLQKISDSVASPFTEDGELANGYVDYSRYWHGSQVLLRPLLAIMPIKAIRMLLGIVMIALNLILCVMMLSGAIRNSAGKQSGTLQGAVGGMTQSKVSSGVVGGMTQSKMSTRAVGGMTQSHATFAFCYAIALMIVSIWMCAFCIEYVTTFLVVSVQLLVLYKLRGELDATNLYIVLCAGGIVTAFMDFLTTETVTLTLPMLLYYVLIEAAGGRDDKGIELGDKRNWLTLIYGIIVWGVSYAGMMGLKWLISMAVLGKEAFLATLRQASLRIAGDATYGNIPGAEAVTNKEQITGALWRNFACLFPFGEAIHKGRAILFTLLALFIIFAVWYLFHKKLDEKSGQFTLILLAISAVPYVRFLVLNNHSYIHFFFTYRAQVVTITALLYLAIKDIAHR